MYFWDKLLFKWEIWFGCENRQNFQSLRSYVRRCRSFLCLHLLTHWWCPLVPRAFHRFPSLQSRRITRLFLESGEHKMKITRSRQRDVHRIKSVCKDENRWMWGGGLHTVLFEKCLGILAPIPLSRHKTVLYSGQHLPKKENALKQMTVNFQDVGLLFFES